jgi:hypothetical protein
MVRERSGLPPGFAKSAELGSSLEVEWFAGLVEFENGGLQIYSEVSKRRSRWMLRPTRFDNAVLQSMGSRHNNPGGFGKHRARVWLSKTFAAQHHNLFYPAHLGAVTINGAPWRPSTV